MRSAAILSLALAAAPLAVSATGTLGFALGDKNADGTCKSTTDFEADFDALSGVTSVVRTYSASDCTSAAAILPAAQTKGFKVVLGVWPDSDSSYEADKSALQSAIPGYEDQVYAITVGSETLYRGSLTGETLLAKIQDMQSAFPSILIGTADSWNKYADGTADALISGGVKLLLVNAFAYWQGQEISNASATYFDDMQQAIAHIQNIAGSTDSIEVWTGETGWPTTGGTNYGSAIAGTDNAETFWKSGVCGMLDWGVSVFYFEAFDEPWKPESTGDDGSVADETHWGAYTSDRTAKWTISC